LTTGKEGMVFVQKHSWSQTTKPTHHHTAPAISASCTGHQNGQHSWSGKSRQTILV